MHKINQLKICQIERDPVDPSRRRVFSSGGFEYDNESYFLGLEYAGNDVFVKPNSLEKQIDVYSDENKEQLLETFPIRDRASEHANPSLRTVSNNQLFSWNGFQVYARLSRPAEFVYVRPHPNEKELDLFSDEHMTAHVGRATIGFDPDNPSLILDGIDRDAQMRFLSYSKADVISFWKRRTSGEVISRIAKDAGLAYEDMERIFKVNNIGVIKGNAADLQDFVQHYHPNARIVTEFKGPCNPIEIKCEHGHYFERLPVNIKDGAWCPDCYQAERFKNEARCRDAVERVLGAKFNKSNPPWLISDAGRKMHLDMYNDQLKIAVEYNGRQHYEVSAFHHQRPEDLQRQQQNDARKEALCKEHGVTLITVPYTIEPKAFDAFIKRVCNRLGIKLG
jgi:hypothetical protein